MRHTNFSLSKASQPPFTPASLLNNEIQLQICLDYRKRLSQSTHVLAVHPVRYCIKDQPPPPPPITFCVRTPTVSDLCLTEILYSILSRSAVRLTMYSKEKEKSGCFCVARLKMRITSGKQLLKAQGCRLNSTSSLMPTSPISHTNTTKDPTWQEERVCLLVRLD